MNENENNDEEDDDDPYTELIKKFEKDVSLQYDLLKIEKDRLLNFLQELDKVQKIEDQENNENSSPNLIYKFNLKCLSKNQPVTRRISTADDADFNNSKDYNHLPRYFMNKWLEIYLSTERNKLIKEIEEKTKNPFSEKLFLHGNAGQGKSHILIDLVARQRFKNLPDGFSKKPKKLTFYWMFSNRNNISDTLLCFAEELYFACFSVIKFEQNQQILKSRNEKLTKLEKLFKNLLKALAMDREGGLFWPIAKEIIDYITIENKILIMVVLDQINEIPKLNEKEKRVNQHFNSIDYFFKDKSLISILKCASNNNQIMRQRIVDFVQDKMDISHEIVRDLMTKKKYPSIVSPIQFQKLTNGIPLFESLIPPWTHGGDEKFPKMTNNLEILIREKKKELRNTIQDYLIEKVKKFKNEYYDKFNHQEKIRFKENLMKINTTQIINLNEEAKYIDFQLMDYEILDAENNFAVLKSTFPNVVGIYQNLLGLIFNKEDELKIDVDEFLENVHHESNQYSGEIFERIVKNHFFFNNKFQKNEKNVHFDLYNHVNFQKSFQLDAISVEQKNKSEVNIDSLSEKHLLRMENLDFFNFFDGIMRQNIFFYNDDKFTPFIDGGFIYQNIDKNTKEDGSLSGKIKVLTYDATIGSKDFNYETIVLKDGSRIKDSDNQNTKMLFMIKKIEETIPDSVLKLISNQYPTLKLSFEFYKQLYIFPDLREMIIKLENLERKDKYKDFIDSYKRYQERIKSRDICRIMQFMKNNKEIENRVEIAMLMITPMFDKDDNIIKYWTKLKKYEQKKIV